MRDHSPITKVVNLILVDSLAQGASEIHVVPLETRLEVRFLIDGVLSTAMEPPRELAGPIATRLKVMAQLEVSASVAEQSGWFTIQVGEDGALHDYLLTVSSTAFGERLVVRREDGALD